MPVEPTTPGQMGDAHETSAPNPSAPVYGGSSSELFEFRTLTLDDGEHRVLCCKSCDAVVGPEGKEPESCFVCEARKARVYVDELFTWVAQGVQAHRTGARSGHRWCHLWSDDVGVLHQFAAKIGMKRAWFQDKPGFPHYDLVPARRAAALKLGAVERPLADWIKEKKRRARQ